MDEQLSPEEPAANEVADAAAPPWSEPEAPAPTNGKKAAVQDPQGLEMLLDVSLELTVELGRTHLTVREILELQTGSIIELDRLAGEAVDIFVNKRLIARGEVVVVDDKFGVRITELASGVERAGL